MKKYAVSYTLISPSVAFILIFMYYPLLSALFHSFTKWDMVTTHWIGFANFGRVFSDSIMGLSVSHQLIFTLTDLLKSIIPPLIVAELIHLLKGKRAKYLLRTGFVLNMLVPGMVGTLLWLSIYNPSYGLLNQLLKFLGLSEWTRAWLAESGTALWAIVMSGFPFISGVSFLIFYAAIGSLNNEVIESSRIDGANGWQVFTKLHIPMLTPQFKVLIILTIIGSLQDFVKVIVLTNGGPGTATVIPAYTMYGAAFASSEYGYASAIGTCLFVVILGLTLLNMKFLKTKW
ncbi:carbohydrate ABC transporter permease [Cohnella endophytica]|nr:sugar ABC transporter permease [Cohnella endophytica]